MDEDTTVEATSAAVFKSASDGHSSMFFTWKILSVREVGSLGLLKLMVRFVIVLLKFVCHISFTMMPQFLRGLGVGGMLNLPFGFMHIFCTTLVLKSPAKGLYMLALL